LGIEVEATCTPRVERKVVAAGTTSSSREQASEQLRDLADLSINAKRCERIILRVGLQRLAEREEQLEQYESLPFSLQREVPVDVPQSSWDHRVAAVMVDGGRGQLRDERWGQPRKPGEEKPQWWRESKVSLVVTFCSQPHTVDPMPEVPENLLDPLWLIPKINEIKAAKGGESAAQQVGSSRHQEVPKTLDDFVEGAGTGNKRQPQWSPEPLVRSVVATFEPYDKLGRLAKAEAYHRGFAAAREKAFVADGHLSNWRIQQTCFPDYTPIVDPLHALSYVYQAAQAATVDMEECWQLCKPWITWIWQGKVDCVLDDLDQRIAQTTDAAVLDTLNTSRGYLHNNRDRMRYDEYRRRGLPITTALMESTIKRINRRIKGTEKFWREGAEPQIQLSADKISETRPLDAFWKKKADAQIGKRKSRSTL
jgi:hypothetical protein